MLHKLFRRLPNFRGKSRFSRLLLGKYIHLAKDILVKGRFNCEYLLPNITESISFEIFIYGIYESETFDFLISAIPQGGCFLDLGANIGSITIPLKKQRQDIQCICVEASPWIVEYLKKNVLLNFVEGSIQILNRALFDKGGEILPFYSPTDKFGKGSFSPAFTKEVVEVTTITIDQLAKDYGLPQVDMIKIDIEGYEYFAFKGAATLLYSEQAPDIFFEFVDWAEELAGLNKGAAQQVLIEAGYNLYRFTENGKLSPSLEVITRGSEMLFASKKSNYRQQQF